MLPKITHIIAPYLLHYIAFVIKLSQINVYATVDEFVADGTSVDNVKISAVSLSVTESAEGTVCLHKTLHHIKLAEQIKLWFLKYCLKNQPVLHVGFGYTE